MVKAAKNAKLKGLFMLHHHQFMELAKKKNVTEDHPLVPLTLYNKYKGLCEPILNKYGDENFTVTTFRPATVCGYAPRLRLDVSVNILTNLAVNNKKITVFGGDQLRPNLDIRDYVDVCITLLNAPHEKVHKDVFNVGYENMSIINIAKLVKKVVENEFSNIGEISILRTDSDDNRSYHINSDKIKKVLGFVPKFSIEDAIISLCNAFKDGKIKNSMEDEIYYNIKKNESLRYRVMSKGLVNRWSWFYRQSYSRLIIE